MASFKSEKTGKSKESPEATTSYAPNLIESDYDPNGSAPNHKDIIRNLRLTEKKHRPKPQYMRKQRDINHKNRSRQIDWLVEMTIVNELETETLHLSVSNMDRFLSQTVVKRAEMKVVGAAALCIAVMYEEGRCAFAFLEKNKFTKEEVEQVKRQETITMRVLDGDVGTPTACAFIDSYAVLGDMPDKLKYLTLYIAELSLRNGELMRYPPSVISSASLALARYTLGMEMWTQQMEDITSYTLENIRGAIRKLSFNKKMVKGPVYARYIVGKYQNVAMIETIDLSKDRLDKLCLEYKNRPIAEEGIAE